MTRAIDVLAPGALTTVQDLGRPGLAGRGIAPAGALDPWALRAANLLAGNAADAGALEAHLVGPVLRARDDVEVVVASGGIGDAPVRLDLTAGEHLDLRTIHGGARSIVIAVTGGIAVPLVLGSRATSVVGEFGGLDGRPLRAGDVLPLGAPVEPRHPASLPPSAWTAQQRDVVVRVVPGPHAEALGADALQTLLGAAWTVTTATSRVGFRLEGPRIEIPEVQRRMPPVGTVAGTVQVSADGEPMVLLVERPVTGGYPQIATVIAADLALFARAPRDARIRFALVTFAVARAALAEREREQSAWEAAL